MNADEEILDLVDEYDEIIGTVALGAFNHGVYEHGYVRAANVLIMNDAGELWIPRRTPHKIHIPNGLDFSVSEHVASGEDYLEAAIRGFAEELSMQVAPSDLVEVGTIKPVQNMPWFARLYLHKSNDTPNFNTNDFSEGMWLRPSDVLQRIETGEAAKSGLPPAIRQLVDYLPSVS